MSDYDCPKCKADADEGDWTFVEYQPDVSDVEDARLQQADVELEALAVRVCLECGAPCGGLPLEMEGNDG